MRPKKNKGRGPCFPSTLDSKIHEMNKRLLARPADINPSDVMRFFEAFASEFFDDNATLTIIHHDPTDRIQHPRKFTIGRLMIPRFFRSMFEGGIVDVQFVVRSSRDLPNPTMGVISLDCDRLTMITQHIKPVHMSVITETHLLCDFGCEDLKIRGWQMSVFHGREYVDRNNAIEAVQHMDLSIRNGLSCYTLMFLKLCAILEPMQELMSRHKAYQSQNVQPRECLRDVVWQKFQISQPQSMNQSMSGDMKPAAPETPAAKPKKQRKRKGSATGTPTEKKPTKKQQAAAAAAAAQQNQQMQQQQQAAVAAQQAQQAQLQAQQAAAAAQAGASPGSMGPAFPLTSHVEVMVVQEPSLMGGEFGGEDERMISRLENSQYNPLAAAVATTSGPGPGGMGLMPPDGVGGGGGPQLMRQHTMPPMSVGGPGPPLGMGHHQLPGGGGPGGGFMGMGIPQMQPPQHPQGGMMSPPPMGMGGPQYSHSAGMPHLGMMMKQEMPGGFDPTGGPQQGLPISTAAAMTMGGWTGGGGCGTPPIGGGGPIGSVSSLFPGGGGSISVGGGQLAQQPPPSMSSVGRPGSGPRSLTPNSIGGGNGGGGAMKPGASARSSTDSQAGGGSGNNNNNGNGGKINPKDSPSLVASLSRPSPS